MRRLARDRVEVGVRKVRLDTLLKEPVEGRCVRDVGGTCLAGTTGEEAGDTSLALSDDGAGITWGGEGAVLVTVWVDGQLHGRLECRPRSIRGRKT